MLSTIKRTQVILDTDIGTNPDDFFALLILLNRKDVDLRLIVTGNGYPYERTQFARVILKNAHREEVVVCEGESKGSIQFYGNKYLPRCNVDVQTNYVERIKNIIDEKGDVMYINIQGCSNIYKFITKYPSYKKNLKVFHMGMTTKDAHKVFVSGGTNMESDPIASRFVYEAGLNLRVVGSHTTINDDLRVHPNTNLYKKLALSSDDNHVMLLDHLNDFYGRRNLWPALHDPVTVTSALGESFVEFEDVNVEFDESGKYRINKNGNTSITVSKKDVKAFEFMDYCERFL